MRKHPWDDGDLSRVIVDVGRDWTVRVAVHIWLTLIARDGKQCASLRVSALYSESSEA